MGDLAYKYYCEFADCVRALHHKYNVSAEDIARITKPDECSWCPDELFLKMVKMICEQEYAKV